MESSNREFTVELLWSVLNKLITHNQFLIAYSGGLDSHVLLHAMSELKKKYKSLRIRAIHINHSLSPNAVAWELHCREVCEKLSVPFLSAAVEVKPTQGESLEAFARQLRYEVFAKHLTEHECLLTAHTQNDQAETLLLQLMRGAGPKGLAAMPNIKKFEKGYLVRPLLQVTRPELEVYAQHRQLKWIEDESNLNFKFDRNFLRHQIIPELKKRWPDVVANIARAASHCAETSHLLDELAIQDLEAIQAAPNQLSISALLKLSPDRERNVLRYWFHKMKVKLPSTQKLLLIQSEVLRSREDAMPLVTWGQVEIQRYRDRIYLLSQQAAHDATLIIPWNFSQPLVLPGALATLTAQKKMGKGIKADLDTKQITVRFRRGGEKCRIPGRAGKHDLKKLFQEWDVPPWERDRVPLIYYQEQLIAVVGFCICEGFQAQSDELGYEII